MRASPYDLYEYRPDPQYIVSNCLDFGDSINCNKFLEGGRYGFDPEPIFVETVQVSDKHQPVIISFQ